ncbi:Oidioi.mRNA.OKI2018_I69.chr2.g7046.t1.cds [Oikopleura dioica]|uniref:Oidioi.mRNA.OKI2018_I69.chr2.g7046.t1.cds n=1 Tax=Oikopleura dioica TaxID=34765 RepID=A0ABN7TB06_OIKDI|nr:Oidioi.mRNA.OKI2018_I69.chr2.g7046.t1.cds [Oikopleura dioica]
MLLLVYVYRKCVETFKSNVRHRNAQEIHNLSLKISKRQKQVTIHDILKNDNTSTTEDVPGALSAKARKEYLKRKDIPLVVKSSAYLLGLENKISLR